MTPLAYLALGMLGGVLVAAPLGPVNIYIIQRAFRYGFPMAFASGLGAALADVLFATLAAFSISTVAAFIEGYSRSIQLFGGVLVLLFGVRILWRQPGFGSTCTAQTRDGSVAEVMASTFALTITNPATIFGFVAYFSALGSWGPKHGDVLGTAQLVVGVMVGTLCWWVGLASLVTKLRSRFNDELLGKINVFGGALMIGFGALILGRLSVTYFKLI